jgi:predicted enzyme related to lactoylglutathione lyase
MDIKDNHINYIEFKAKDLDDIIKFYSEAFGWTFTSYGENYISFSEGGVAGGFEKTDESITNGVLVILYHSNLQQIKNKVIKSGGQITKDIFSFPGGHRFHFQDPSGNELAVWSE